MIQPAPMGRAYRIQKRKAHITVHVSDEVKAVNARKGETAAAAAPSAPATNAKKKPAGKAGASRKRAAAK